MLLPVLDGSNTASVTSSSNHAKVIYIELNKLYNLPCLSIDLHGFVPLDQRIRVSNSPSVVGANVWNALVSKVGLADLAKLVLDKRKGHVQQADKTAQSEKTSTQLHVYPEWKLTYLGFLCTDSVQSEPTLAIASTTCTSPPLEKISVGSYFTPQQRGNHECGYHVMQFLSEVAKVKGDLGPYFDDESACRFANVGDVDSFMLIFGMYMDPKGWTAKNLKKRVLP
ncbi:hypothetical protein R1sor_020863 [Riccia sorocarpa]|uniref:Ubiquitin-like protease family profile domain-containing protein n=1 Tax=Riccia sorocarpa TaxID=122646 RepID=A0ABD3GH68_9MARC